MTKRLGVVTAISVGSIALVFLGIVTFSKPRQIEANNVQACLSAIRAYGDSLSKRPDLPANAVAEGLYAFAIRNYDGQKIPYDAQSPGKKDDIHECTKFGVHSAAIKTLIAFDTEPLPVVFKSPAQCTAAMVFLQRKIEDEFGRDGAAKIGSNMGTALGQAGLIFKYMLKVSDLSPQLLRGEAQKLIAADSSPNAFAKWVQACDRIGVETHSVIDRLKNSGRL